LIFFCSLLPIGPFSGVLLAMDGVFTTSQCQACGFDGIQGRSGSGMLCFGGHRRGHRHWQ
jgi:hypothetical protein